jgi:exodeoxyribonuclease VII large subunit
MEETGDGQLRQAFEQLKQRLFAEGLFDEIHKKPLPSWPQHIGIISSATGAALQDILQVLKRRYPLASVTIYPVSVQGFQACGEIISALQLATQRADNDILILARGGGSLEDLQAFNDEGVARAIVTCPIPIITGIGHETDTTIADFVADRRAPTPSAAAEIASPDQGLLLQAFEAFKARLQHAMSLQQRHRGQQLKTLQQRMRHPGQQILWQSQRLDELTIRLQQAIKTRYWSHYSQHLKQLSLRLQQSTLYQLSAKSARLAQASNTLQALNPEHTLTRGYAIVRNTQSPPTILHKLAHIQPGENIEITLSDGKLRCLVNHVIEH